MSSSSEAATRTSLRRHQDRTGGRERIGGAIGAWGRSRQRYSATRASVRIRSPERRHGNLAIGGQRLQSLQEQLELLVALGLAAQVSLDLAFAFRVQCTQ